MILGVMGSQFLFLTWPHGVKGVVAVLLTAQLVCVVFFGFTDSFTSFTHLFEIPELRDCISVRALAYSGGVTQQVSSWSHRSYSSHSSQPSTTE